MPKNHSDIIRASEIATYCFCQRAWSFQRQGVPSQNIDAISEGSQYHRRHGRTVTMIMVARLAAIILIVLAFVLFLVR